MLTVTSFKRLKLSRGSRISGFVFILLALIITAVLPVGAVTAPIFSTSRDCSADAIIFCGAMNVNELNQRYAAIPSVGVIYANMGISALDVKATPATAGAGVVNFDGSVVMSGQVVAVRAITAGRTNIPGSTPTTSGGITFYKHSTRSSFKTGSMPAFVVVQNNVFRFAIIAANGSPVQAVGVRAGQNIPAPSTPSPAPIPSSAPAVTAAANQPVTFNSKRDCDANAVIRCGAMTTPELILKFKADPTAAVIFANMGISDQNVTNMTSTAVAGQVTTSGLVIVSGQTVATQAISAGRQNFPGSTPVQTSGFTFYKRPTSVSFASSPLDAFVVMQNNRFAFAVLASCGNPVTAVPVVHQAAVVTPKPPTPPPPPPTPPAPAPAPPALPNTGMNHLAGIFLISTATGIGVYQLLLRRKLHH